MKITIKSLFTILTLLFAVLALTSCTKEEDEPKELHSVYVYSDSIEVVIDPNPNSGTFTVLFDQAYQKIEIDIYNMHAEEVFSSVVINSMEKMLSLDAPKGIYLVMLTSQSGYTTARKMIIE